MSTTNSKQPPAVARTRPYKDFLNAELHRRFLSAMVIATGLCYVEAVCMGQTSVWALNPFGSTLPRTLLLVTSSLLVYILRVARSHIGDRIPSSSTQALKLIFGPHAIFTWALYFFSAVVFAETYIALGDGRAMGRIEHGRAHERDRINERPVYFRTILLGFLVPSQTVLHLLFDYDKIRFSKEPSTNTPVSMFTFAAALHYGKRAVHTMNFAFWHSAAATLVGTIIFYATSVRYLAWRVAYYFNYLFVPKAAGPGKLPSTGIYDLPFRTFFESFLLLLIWATVNKTFDHYMSQEPLKNGQPLTNESKDQNGSLVQGLRSKRELPRSFAFWELALITQRFEPRRQSIYEDFSRNAWQKVLDACIAEISEITKRIESTKPPPPPAPPAPQVIETLPRIAQPLKQDNVLNPNPLPNARVNALGQYAKQHGSTPRKDHIRPLAAKLVEYSHDVVPQVQADLQQRGAKGLLIDRLLPIIRNPYIGPYLRLTFRYRAIMSVAGSPYSRLSAILSAIEAIANLAVHSLQEDKYAQVAPHIPTIVRTIVAALKSIQGFVATAEPHWSDVDFKEEDRVVPEVEMIRKKLVKGLEKVLIAHGEFLESEGLARAEIREAKALVSTPEVVKAKANENGHEMEQVK